MLFLWDQERNIFEPEQGVKALQSLIRFRYKKWGGIHNCEKMLYVKKAYCNFGFGSH